MESPFMRALLVELSKIPGLRVWRQNSGRVVFRDPTTGRARAFNAGPPPGAADISGIYAGDRNLGIRVEVETKDAGKTQSPEQARWGEFVLRHGGVYVLAVAEAGATTRQNARTWREKIETILRSR